MFQTELSVVPCVGMSCYTLHIPEYIIGGGMAGYRHGRHITEPNFTGARAGGGEHVVCAPLGG